MILKAPDKGARAFSSSWPFGTCAPRDPGVPLAPPAGWKSFLISQFLFIVYCGYLEALNVP